MQCGVKNELLFKTILLFVSIFSPRVRSILRAFSECHQDFTLHPKDGYLPPYTFSWIGILQYEHVITGFARYADRAPRVVLIHRQFVIAATRDVKYIPVNYKLGKIVLDDYERLETDCGLTVQNIIDGGRCPRAVIEIPIAKVIYHPEHIGFKVELSLALVKLASPVKSPYVLPICLPSTEERRRQVNVKQVFLVDYVSMVPKDFSLEKKAKKTLRLLDEAECRSIRNNLTLLYDEIVLQVLCTSGCSIRSGSPIVTHNPEGAFEIMGISVGGGSCQNKAMRNKVIRDPPLYVDVYPFKNWLINVITANLMPTTFPVILGTGQSGRRQSLSTQFFIRTNQRHGWSGRWYVHGDACYKKGKDDKRETTVFYFEVFEVKTYKQAKLKYFLELSAGYETTILCTKMRMPHRKNVPEVTGLGTYKINVTFESLWFPKVFELVIGVFGMKSTNAEINKWKLGNKGASPYWNQKKIKLI